MKNLERPSFTLEFRKMDGGIPNSPEKVSWPMLNCVKTGSQSSTAKLTHPLLWIQKQLLNNDRNLKMIFNPVKGLIMRRLKKRIPQRRTQITQI